MYKFNDISENNSDESKNSSDDEHSHNDEYSSDDERDNKNNNKRNRNDDYSSDDDERNNKNKNKNKRRRFNELKNPLLRIIFSSPPPFLKKRENNKCCSPKKNEEKDEIEDRNDDDYFKTDDILYPIDMKIKNLDDLINLGKSYNEKEKKKYVINLKILNRCVPALIELKNMIGMKSIKERIVDLFFFYLQNFTKGDNNNMLHTIIEGTPGSGKTEVAKILAKIYYNMGIVKSKKFRIAKRSDLIGKYLGHTAMKTQEVFDKAENGVLFIDEAYSLGNAEGKDSFSKECIDTINQNLTEMKDKIIVIIAGYKKQLQESFFSYNPGLLRRFPFRFTIDEYIPKDLMNIYKKMVREDEWILDEKDKIELSFFKKNREFFPFNGGDMEILWNFTKMVHSRRVFGQAVNLRKKINKIDLDNAFKLFTSNDEVKNRKDKLKLSKEILSRLYC